MIRNTTPLFFPVRTSGGSLPARIWAFPGQGSQKVGMGRDFYQSSLTYKTVVDQGCDFLLGHEGVDLRKTIFEGPADELTRTLHAQPALLISNFAFFEHIRAEEGIEPAPNDFVAGHSLGEWTAYTAARALTVEQAALAVYWRGRYMEEAFPFDPKAGSPMAAVMGLPEEIIVEVCRQISRLDHVVVAANLNTPVQLVISGHIPAVAEASQILKDKGASKVVPLKVAGPFHSPLMRPVKEKLALKLEELDIRFSPPQYTVLANFTAQPMEKDADHLGSLLNQIDGSVLWRALMMRSYELGVVQMVNVDVSGKVLLGMAEEIFSREVPVQSVDPAIPMHRHALRFPAGTVRTTVFQPAPETATRRLLEFSYNATAIVQEIRRLMGKGDIQTALLVLDNRYNLAREAGLRELRTYDRPEVAEAMKTKGFVTPEGEILWPDPVVRDLPTHPLPSEVETQLKNQILPALQQLSLAPIEGEDLLYYVASRWNGEQVRLDEILKGLRDIWKYAEPENKKYKDIKLSLMKYRDENGEEQKGIDGWEKVVLCVDGGEGVAFPYPGAMTQGECM